MGISVGSDLPTAFCVYFFEPVQGHTPVDGSGSIGGPFRREASAVDVEGAFQPVFFHDGDQLFILLHTVVIAQGKGLGQAARETHDHIGHKNSPCFLFLIILSKRKAVVKKQTEGNDRSLHSYQNQPELLDWIYACFGTCLRM